MYQPSDPPLPSAPSPGSAAATPAAAYPATAYTPQVSSYTNYSAGASTVSFAGYPPATPTAPQPPARGVSPPPAEPTVTPRIAEGVVRKLVTVELQGVGFEKGEPTAVQRLEYEVQAFVQQLYERAHEYANLSNRAGAIAYDLLRACEEFDMPITELHAVVRKSKKRKRRSGLTQLTNTTVEPTDTRASSPDLLGSDDEGSTVALPTTLRSLPSYFPSLPPKHTYMKTPASPPKKAALPSLEKKLKTAGLVQKSLQNLLTATEDNNNNEDAELLGHIVNWETGIHPRKRWKVQVRK